MIYEYFIVHHKAVDPPTPSPRFENPALKIPTTRLDEIFMSDLLKLQPELVVDFDDTCPLVFPEMAAHKTLPYFLNLCRSLQNYGPGSTLHVSLDISTWDTFWTKALFDALRLTEARLEVTLVVGMPECREYRFCRVVRDESKLISSAAKRLQRRGGALTVFEDCTTLTWDGRRVPSKCECASRAPLGKGRGRVWLRNCHDAEGQR